jgi:hypothetical protein
LTRLRDTANIAMDFPTKVGGIEEDVPTGVDFG